VGTGPSSNSSSVARVCFVRCEKFDGTFMMPFCSFGGISDQCGATSWAAQETGMVHLLSCEVDLTEWLKEKYQGVCLKLAVVPSSETTKKFTRQPIFSKIKRLGVLTT